MRRATVTVLTLLAALGAGAASAQVPIREIRLTLDPTTYSGPCPVRLRAHIVFVSNYPARVDEDNWGWNFGRLAPHSWDVPGGHLRTSGRETAVDTTLTLPRAGDTAGGLLHEGSVYVIMELAPTISNKVAYSVRCSPAVSIDPNLVKPVRPGPTIALQKAPTIPLPSGKGAGPAVHFPDLVVGGLEPVAGNVVVTNSGPGPAGPTELSIRIRCLGDDGEGTGCAGRFAWPPGVAVDPSLGGPVLPVPPLAPGVSRTIPVPSWAAIKFAPGKYELIAQVDVRNAATETSEANNTRLVRFTR